MRKFLIALAIVLTGCGQNKKTDSGEGINGLPPLFMKMVTGEQIMVSSLSGNVILVFFSPDCDHCQREAADIQGKLDAFKEYTLYFISASAVEDINLFAETYHLSGIPNVLFAQASVEDVVRVMGPLSSPTMFIYSDKKLVKKIEGETKAEEIIKLL